MYEIDPLRDPRWAAFLKRHPRASVFHTAGWLEALRRAYGYEPVVYTTSQPGMDLTNGLVFCRVDSWLTGRRIVSLPFSDHSEPLVENEEELARLVDWLRREASKQKWQYIEIRPSQLYNKDCAGLEESSTFYGHKIDLHPSAGELFRSFHKSCVQRKIRRAEREGLAYEEGRSEALLTTFYRLLVSACRRRHLPPQPLVWFRHLIDCLGENLKIRVASKDGRPVAAIVTLNFKGSMVFKYGCSDTRFNCLGGTHLLLWRAIQEAKRDNLHEFDLGRSDCGAIGLVAFKERWGSTRSLITYFRCTVSPSPRAIKDWKIRVAKTLLTRLPDRFLTAVGETFYQHMG